MGAKVLSTDMVHQNGAEGVINDFSAIIDLQIELDNDQLTPPGVPYVRQKAREDVYHLLGTISNDTRSETIELDVFVDVSDAIEIDTENRTIRNTTADQNIFPTAEFGDDEATWLQVQPGDNTFSWTEVGVVSVVIDVDHYDRWE